MNELKNEQKIDHQVQLKTLNSRDTKRTKSLEPKNYEMSLKRFTPDDFKRINLMRDFNLTRGTKRRSEAPSEVLSKRKTIQKRYKTLTKESLFD